MPTQYEQTMNMKVVANLTLFTLLACNITSFFLGEEGDHLQPSPQKEIHPIVDNDIDIEAQPTKPLVPRNVPRESPKFNQDKGGHRVSFKEHLQSRTLPPPPLRPPVFHNTNNIPVTNTPIPPPKKAVGSRHSTCCKWMCWSISLLIVLVIIVGATIGILYLVFKLKIPQYSVDKLRVSDLRLNLDLSLYVRFNVRITAIMNQKIGIHYQKGSHLSLWYSSTKLCQGTLPKFYQGHQNKTVLNVLLVGQSQYGRTLIAALQEQQQTGRIPLDLKVDVPVRIQLGKLKLKEVRILGKCFLIVDSLSANNMVSIKASTCKFGLKL